MSSKPPIALPQFAQALQTQGRVIGALLMRELHTRYGRENIGYLWMILEPMTFAGAVALLHSREGRVYGTDISGVPFGILGYTVFIIFRGIFTRAEGTIESNKPLLYHRMVTLLDMLIARALLEGAGVGMTLVILLALAWSLGLADPPARPLWEMLAIAYMVWFSFAASMVACAATNDNRLVSRLIHPATYILMPISGGFYIMSWVPEPYRTWLGYLPLTHIFEMARYGQFASAGSDYFDVIYLTGSCICLTVIGMLSIRIVRNHVHLS